MVQFRNTKTREAINIGVICFDERCGTFALRTLPCFTWLQKRFRLEEIAGIDLALAILRKRLEIRDFESGYDLSNFIHITRASPVVVPWSLTVAADELFDQVVTLAGGTGGKLNPSEKSYIIDNLKKIKRDRSYENLLIKKKLRGASTTVDAVTVVENRVPVVAAQVVSPYVEDFTGEYARSLYVLEELELFAGLRLPMVYVPSRGHFSRRVRRNIRNARAHAEAKKLHFLDTGDPNEFLEIMEEETEKQGAD